MEFNKSIRNSSHKNSHQNYYEWWYFHFISKEYGVFNIVLHETDIFGIDKNSYYSATLFNKNNDKPVYLKGKETNFDIDLTGNYLLTDHGLFSEDKSSLNINLEFTNGMKIIGKIDKSQSSPVMLSNGVLYSNDEGFGMWVPQFINSEFELEITTVDGDISKISGIAYHDHQWGNCQIQNAVNCWNWGHLVGEKEAIVFFKVLLNNGSTVDRYIIWDGNMTSCGVDAVSSDFMRNFKLERLEGHSQKVNLCLGLDHKIKYRQDINSIMRKRINEKIGTKHMNYIRWYVSGNIDNNIELNGVAEYMSFI